MQAISLSELERLVTQAEDDASLQRTLRRCRSRQQLIHTARRLGYRITQSDLQRAWQLERREQHQAGGDQPAAAVIGAGI